MWGMKNSSFKSPSHPLLGCVSSLQAGNPVLSWDLEQEEKQTEIVTLGMCPGVESVPFLSDKPHSHSSKAKSCFPSSSVPFCCLPLIRSQTGKAGAPRWRWDTWHFLLESARNILLHPKIVNSLPAQGSRSHWVHQVSGPGPGTAQHPLCHAQTPPSLQLWQPAGAWPLSAAQRSWTNNQCATTS